MTDIRANRRDMLRATAGIASASLLGVLNVSSALTAEMGKVAGRSEKPLKAAFSNIGLQVSWCAQGKQAAEYWGKLFNVDVTWFDGVRARGFWNIVKKYPKVEVVDSAPADWDVTKVASIWETLLAKFQPVKTAPEPQVLSPA